MELHGGRKILACACRGKRERTRAKQCGIRPTTDEPPHMLHTNARRCMVENNGWRQLLSDAASPKRLPSIFHDRGVLLRAHHRGRIDRWRQPCVNVHPKGSSQTRSRGQVKTVGWVAFLNPVQTTNCAEALQCSDCTASLLQVRSVLRPHAHVRSRCRARCKCGCQRQCTHGIVLTCRTNGQRERVRAAAPEA